MKEIKPRITPLEQGDCSVVVWNGQRRIVQQDQANRALFLAHSELGFPSFRNKEAYQKAMELAAKKLLQETLPQFLEDTSQK